MRNSKLLKKKKAVTMLEAIVSIFIIFIMFSVVVKLVQHNNKILEKREEIEQGHRVVYCIMQEIKERRFITQTDTPVCNDEAVVWESAPQTKEEALMRQQLSWE